jgi:hypothetical protein
MTDAIVTGGLDIHRFGTAIEATMGGLTITSGGTTIAVSATLTGFSATGWAPTNGPGTCALPFPQQHFILDGLVFQPA